MTTQENRLTRLETKHEMSMKEINKNIAEIKSDMKSIMSLLAPMPEMLRKVNEHHEDLKVIKPNNKHNTEFRKVLQQSGCPIDKVHREDIEERAKEKRKVNFFIIATLISLLGIIAKLYEAF